MGEAREGGAQDPKADPNSAAYTFAGQGNEYRDEVQGGELDRYKQKTREGNVEVERPKHKNSDLKSLKSKSVKNSEDSLSQIRLSHKMSINN